MGLRLGILGGTFDPVHYGHLIIAQEAATQLALDAVLFLPAGIQPLKRHQPTSSAAARVAMVEAAIAGNPRFRLSRADVDHPGLSYTVATLDRLRAEWGAAAAFWLIVGEDALANLRAWRDPAGIIARARLAVAPRPAVQVPWDALAAALPGLREGMDRLSPPLVAISSTDLRARCAAGRPIRYQVPPAVEDYIQTHRLYRAEARQ
ncbi:MAG TPA: nicotinate-nucleotide adenylyltransferase [Chloroflexia bacterium]|nr:nicotinate-nucleotide adenylyltransferase [Chloroflexia bacterium]